MGVISQVSSLLSRRARFSPKATTSQPPRFSRTLVAPFADVLTPIDADHFIANEPVLKLDYSFDDSEKDDVYSK